MLILTRVSPSAARGARKRSARGATSRGRTKPAGTTTLPSRAAVLPRGVSRRTTRLPLSSTRRRSHALRAATARATSTATPATTSRRIQTDAPGATPTGASGADPRISRTRPNGAREVGASARGGLGAPSAVRITSPSTWSWSPTRTTGGVAAPSARSAALAGRANSVPVTVSCVRGLWRRGRRSWRISRRRAELEVRTLCTQMIGRDKEGTYSFQV